ncbi:hypothetical protein ACFQ69_36705 [Streptomyces sp. NPDC056470]|uniref:hypothetical protein n=1 Tax=Streptomyces sp. NPDC056470 TaxID=3345831 RepID=UPI0036BCED5E
MVWVCLADEPHFPLPEFPMCDDERYTKVFLDREDWRCSAPRRTENYCDLSHLAFVHGGTLGAIGDQDPPPGGVAATAGSAHGPRQALAPI